jgi:hypothetical protein
MYFVILWSFEAMAQTLSLVFANPLLGMLGFLEFWFCNFLFAGLLVSKENIIWPFRIVHYIVPFTWRGLVPGAVSSTYPDTVLESAPSCRVSNQ